MQQLVADCEAIGFDNVRLVLTLGVEIEISSAGSLQSNIDTQFGRISPHVLIERDGANKWHLMNC